MRRRLTYVPFLPVAAPFHLQPGPFPRTPEEEYLDSSPLRRQQIEQYLADTDGAVCYCPVCEIVVLAGDAHQTRAFDTNHATCGAPLPLSLRDALRSAGNAVGRRLHAALDGAAATLFARAEGRHA